MKFESLNDGIRHISGVLNLSTDGAQWVYDNTDCPRWDDPAFTAYDFLADPALADIPAEYV